MEEYLINLVVGDWSHDGHGKSEVFTISSNIDVNDLEEAFARGVKTLGFDPLEDFEEYESYTFDEATIERLERFVHTEHGCNSPFEGYPITNVCEYLGAEKSDDEMWLYPKAFVRLYCLMVKIGNPFFYCRIQRNPNTVKIGGYGLYS